MVHGVGRDAARAVARIVERTAGATRPDGVPVRPTLQDSRLSARP
jgi:hypothetical protein